MIKKIEITTVLLMTIKIQRTNLVQFINKKVFQENYNLLWKNKIKMKETRYKINLIISPM